MASGQENRKLCRKDMASGQENRKLCRYGFPGKHFVSTMIRDHKPGNETNDDVVDKRTRKHAYPIFTKRELFDRTFAKHTSEDYVLTKAPFAGIVVPQPRGHWLDIVSWSEALNLERDQRMAFEVLVASAIINFYKKYCPDTNAPLPIDDEERSFQENIVGLRKLARLCAHNQKNRTQFRTENQLVLFLHGPAGSGKTTILQLFHEYMLQFDRVYTAKAIILSAINSAGAYELGGIETHQAVAYYKRYPCATEEEQEEFDGTDALIIDNCSYLGSSDILKMNILLNFLRKMKNDNTILGGMIVVFAGDLRQLPPVRQKTVYEDPECVFPRLINCYIELGGIFRYRSDPEFGRFLKNARDGIVDQQYLESINSRCMFHPSFRRVPNEATFVCPTNREQDEINEYVFSEFANHTDSTAAILMGKLAYYRNVPSDDGHREAWFPTRCHETLKEKIWQNSASAKLELVSVYRFDVVLKTYYDCPLMLNRNVDIANGLTIGLRFLLKRIVLKPGAKEKLFAAPKCYRGIPAYEANDVEYILGQHITGPRSGKLFKLCAKEFRLRMKFQSRSRLCKYRLKGLQFPCVFAQATTLFNVHGLTIDKLSVPSWNPSSNWTYTTLSRAPSREDLFIEQPLTARLFSYPQKLRDFLATFVDKKPLV